MGFDSEFGQTNDRKIGIDSSLHDAQHQGNNVGKQVVTLGNALGGISYFRGVDRWLATPKRVSYSASIAFSW